MRLLGRIAKIVLIVLISLAGLFLIYVNINIEGKSDLSYLKDQLAELSPTSVSVENVKLYTQPDGFSCGVTSISVIASFLEKKDLPPGMLIEKYQLSKGMTCEKFVDLLNQESNNYTFTYKHDQSDLDLIREIHEQLNNGIPVPVFFGAPNPYNKPLYDFHASVVTGIDLEKQEIHILNVYGYEEQLSLVEFLNRMSYLDTKNYPFVQKAVLKLGMMDKNSFILITPKE